MLSEYALRRAVAGHRRRARAKSRSPSSIPALKEQAALFEDATRDLATAADRILRKHGKNIIDKQFATRRLADIMIDLFVLACVLSRVRPSVHREGRRRARRRSWRSSRSSPARCSAGCEANFGKIDDNDDELIKSLADHAFARRLQLGQPLTRQGDRAECEVPAPAHRHGAR